MDWGGRGGTQNWQRAYDPHANYGASNFDVRNSFKGNVLYQLPFGRGRMFLNNNWLLDSVIGGWQASGTIVLNSGAPFTPVISGNSDTSFSQAGNGFKQYPNLIGNPSIANRSIQKWFNTAAYAVPAPGTFGNVRRNSLVGPGLTNVNFSLGKSFPIWRESQITVRADANNVFNHPSFGFTNPQTVNIDSGNSSINQTTVGGRTMQLGARLSF